MSKTERIKVKNTSNWKTSSKEGGREIERELKPKPFWNSLLGPVVNYHPSLSTATPIEPSASLPIIINKRKII